jgi:hypothetical protein
LFFFGENSFNYPLGAWFAVILCIYFSEWFLIKTDQMKVAFELENSHSNDIEGNMHDVNKNNPMHK